MFKRNLFTTITGSFALLTSLGAPVLSADSLTLVTSPSAQQASDSVNWSRLGGDQTLLNAGVSISTMKGAGVQVTLAGPNSILSKVCSASPCSWTGAGFTAGETLLWTSDAGNGGTGPVHIAFSRLAGAGAYLQANGPGPFTAKIEAFNGSNSLGAFTAPSNPQGSPVYLGVLDHTGANITSVTFSLTATTTGLSSDFALDTVQLTASQGAPAVRLSPTSLVFPKVWLKARSAAQSVTLTNSGTAPLSLTSIAATGDFAQSNNCPNPLAASASCTMNVSFAPTGLDTRTGAVKVTDNASGSPQVISLSGIGTEVKLSAYSLGFPATAVGKTSAAQTVTLTNLGTSALGIGSFSFTGANIYSFIQSNTCGGSVAAGASCKISISFKPRWKGALSASLTITDNGGASPQHVAVTGTGQ